MSEKHLKDLKDTKETNIESNLEESEKKTSVPSKKVKDIDFSFGMMGPLFIPERLKKPNFIYQFVTTDGSTVDTYSRWGYEVVLDEDIEVGEDRPNTASNLGAAHVIKSKCGQTLVLMAIEEDLHKRLMAFRDAENKKTEESIGHLDKVPDEFSYGSVNRKSDKYTK